MKRENWYLSTIDQQAQTLAVQYGLGLEIAEYCTASNMDDLYAQTDALVRNKLRGISRRVLHGPFNELFPCAIDPKARALARERYIQAIALARDYGANKVVIHGGYNPRIYYPCWYTEQSILFWREFLREIPQGMEVCLENVLEEEPGMLIDIVRAVEDPRLRLCLDVGHVNAYSKIPAVEWVERCAPWLSHFHIHNNDGSWDTHSALNQGTLPMEKLLDLAQQVCPEGSYTLELAQAEESVLWLIQKKLMEDVQ